MIFKFGLTFFFFFFFFLRFWNSFDFVTMVNKIRRGQRNQDCVRELYFRFNRIHKYFIQQVRKFRGKNYTTRGK